MRTAKTDQTGRMPSDLSLRWALKSFYLICHAAARFIYFTCRGGCKFTVKTLQLLPVFSDSDPVMTLYSIQ